MQASRSVRAAVDARWGWYRDDDVDDDDEGVIRSLEEHLPSVFGIMSGC